MIALVNDDLFYFCITLPIELNCLLDWKMVMQLEYFEAILNQYFTPDARESLKSLQGVLLEKATENVTDVVENPGHQRKSTRGSEELADERQLGMTISPDDLIVSSMLH